MLAINTGMRASEICGLTWAQVDFLAKSLTVGKSKTAAGTGHRWKVAWESARKSAKVSCRFHDFRHTFISRPADLRLQIKR